MDMKNRFKLYFIIFTLFSFIFTSAITEQVSAKNTVVKTTKRKHKVKKLEVRNNKIIYRKVVDKSVPYIGATNLHNNSYKGDNTYVVIVDTGIISSHPFVTGKVALEACFTQYKSCPNKTNSQTGKGAAAPVDWHGTHVAGIAAGKSTSYTGVAPNAKIIAINVFDKDMSSSDASIVKALNWILSISSSYNIASVNMSLGTSRIYQSQCDSVSPALTTAIHNLYNKNIATVVATGNSGSFGMSNPACISKVVSVAAMDLSSNITPFSNLSANTTFAAPGLSILSAGTGSSMIRASGTSMATPHVTGLFALYRQIYPTHTIQQAINRITASSPLANDPFSNIKIPSINVSNILSTPIDAVPSTTTSTIPAVTTTTSQPPLVIPTNPPLPAFKPLLMKVYSPTINSSYFFITYQDTFVNKSIVTQYVLECNNGLKYNFSPIIGKSSHVLRIDSYPTFSSCKMYAQLNDGTLSASSSSIILQRG